MCLTARLYFFFLWFGGHRDLHSFPTRRSSDLFACGPRADACGSCGGLRRLPALDLPSNQLSTMPRQRSEEHTSELQSRENLVCRLLLEKKKFTAMEAAFPTCTKLSCEHRTYPS